MNRFLTYLLLVPCLSTAGTIYYTDSPQPIIQEESFPERAFEHPEFEKDYDIKEAYYMKDKKETKKIIFKKNSSFFEFNFGYSDLSVSEVKPYYYAQHYTQEIDTVNNSSSTSASTGSVSTQTLTIDESFSINNEGNFDVTFPSTNVPPTYPDPTKQPALQMNMFTRNKHLGYGLEMSYINSPTITVPSATNPSYPEYIISQSQTSTTSNVNNSTGGSSSSSVSTSMTMITAPVSMDQLNIKVVNVPMHFSLMYFPIYDGYFQPYLKAGIGVNFTHTVMDIKVLNNPTTNTMVPLHQEGWAFMPFTYTYGGGLQIMLTENLALSFSYLKLKIDGRTTRFKVMLQQPATGQYSSAAYPTNYAGTYGDMRFEFKQKTNITEIGIALYL